MSILRFARATFDPHDIDAMYEAFVDVCAELHIPKNDNQAREIIASRIIDLARSGIIDSDALRDRVIQESKAIAIRPPQLAVSSENGPRTIVAGQ